MNLFYLRYFVTLAHVQHYTKSGRAALYRAAQFKPCNQTNGKRAWTASF